MRNYGSKITTARYRLSIRDNHRRTDEPCAICNNWTQAIVPIALYMADSPRIVCNKCGMFHNRTMTLLLRTAYIAEEITFSMYPWLIDAELEEDGRDGKEDRDG